ncbi:unnamed protein product (macronuclear) [Paramecium tetraurelia]|uniref:Uncharacterized protein n=1 Tax=Paramecium tetraurelia TaxID=5888 RepID=A0D6F7_PARTE|nr:uncharacterized protein GSPATT00001665001 [Paramecium tetraurelia]CAK78624.1 unnamed protein product [Paramecium tetraurelia]|eukprot:XP_001446021.1 hypothetical protein (macronuclear) [Paramecium tetraurelia strain d4-2]
MSKKVKQLAEVIALQEKTIGKLQKIIETKKSKQIGSRKNQSIKLDQKYLVGTNAKPPRLDFNETNRSYRCRPSISQTHNQLSQISTDYIQDIQSLRGKIEGLQKEKQDRSLFFQDKENWNNNNNNNNYQKVEILEKQIKDRESTINVLQEQLVQEKQLRQQTQQDLKQQRTIWNKMYSELSNEIKTLKTELRAFSSQPKKRSNQLFFS